MSVKLRMASHGFVSRITEQGCTSGIIDLQSSSRNGRCVSRKLGVSSKGGRLMDSKKQFAQSAIDGEECFKSSMALLKQLSASNQLHWRCGFMKMVQVHR